MYLFGASPAVCSTFVAGRSHALEPLSEHTLYLPYATSLRMGRLGYQSDAQSALAVSYNCLQGYASTLQTALTEPYPAYEAIGVRDSAGQWLQLNTHLLQIENEFYGTIRPKRVIRSGERPLHALRERGVEYVEVRLMDLDPFETVGINTRTMQFLDVFLLHCLLSASPDDTPAEIMALGRNQHLVAERGREPGLLLERGDGSTVALTTWGDALVAQMQPIAQALDAALDTSAYTQAVAHAAHLLAHPEDTPSARVLQRIQNEHQSSFVAFARAQSQATHAQLLSRPLTAQQQAAFVQESRDSVAEQARIEAADTLDFDTYLAQYLSHDKLVV
jgi:glutamate--cysteine ligase